MSTPVTVDQRVAIADALHSGTVEWQYDEDVDELELVLPDGARHEGRAVLVGGEFYVRLDVETSTPLSIIIPAFTSWLQRQRAKETQASALVDYWRVGTRPRDRMARKAQSLRPHPPESPDATTTFRAVIVALRYSSDLALAVRPT